MKLTIQRDDAVDRALLDRRSMGADQAAHRRDIGRGRALGTVGILIFISSWNSFIWPLVFMRTDAMFTLPVGIAGLNSEQMAEYGMIMAAAITACIPMLVVFFLMQKQIIAGQTRGAVKA